MATLNLNNPAELDIVTPHSYALNVVFSFFDDADEPLPLDGSFKLMVTRNAAGQRAVLTINPVIDDNKLIVSADKETMSTVPHGEYFYDIRHTAGNAEQRLFAGKFIVATTQTK